MVLEEQEQGTGLCFSVGWLHAMGLMESSITEVPLGEMSGDVRKMSKHQAKLAF
jgi:hypothetical protein